MPDCIELPLQQNHVYLPFPPASLEQFLRAIRGAASKAAVLILPQINAFFFFLHPQYGSNLYLRRMEDYKLQGNLCQVGLLVIRETAEGHTCHYPFDKNHH